jgi:hypothetical protein
MKTITAIIIILFGILLNGCSEGNKISTVYHLTCYFGAEPTVVVDRDFDFVREHQNVWRAFDYAADMRYRYPVESCVYSKRKVTVLRQ